MPGKLREINLEEGKPFVDQAIRRLTFELQQSRRSGYTVLKIIHGYGSSGRGGRIRTEARTYLTRVQFATHCARTTIWSATTMA